MTQTQTVSETLSARQQAIVPITAFAASGNISRLSVALNQGLDAGLTVSDARELLVQVYATESVQAARKTGVGDWDAREGQKAAAVSLGRTRIKEISK